MKKSIKFVALPLVLALSVSVANAYQDCNAKRAAIEYQISQAKAYGNTYKVMSLERALTQVDRNCGINQIQAQSDKKIIKLEKQLAEKQAGVRAIQADLNRAIARNDYKQIAKFQKKLAAKQYDVSRVQAELDAAKA